MRDVARSRQAFALLQDQKASGTAGGTFTSGAWQTRTLNTIVADTIGGVTLVANQFVLPAGTYWIEAKAPAVQVNQHAARLQNITDATTVFSGTSEYVAATDGVQVSSWVIGRFTISAPKTFELQHRCATTATNNGFGVTAGGAFAVGVEVYASVSIVKE